MVMARYRVLIANVQQINYLQIADFGCYRDYLTFECNLLR